MARRTTQNKNDGFGFLLVSAGLLIGFFLGAGIVYLYFDRPPEHPFTDAALERIARVFRQDGEAPAATVTTEQTASRLQRQETVSGADLPAAAADTLSPPADEPISREPSAETDPQETTASEGPPPVPTGSATEFPAQADLPGGQPAISSPSMRLQRDRLVSTMGFTLPPDDRPEKTSAGTQRLDSLLGNRPVARTIYLDFWESPLNFSGYKREKNRVVVYGLDPFEPVSLHALDTNLFLKYADFYFLLETTPDFKPLIPLDDQGLIEKLEMLWP
jgi:hypothetical protein